MSNYILMWCGSPSKCTFSAPMQARAESQRRAAEAERKAKVDRANASRVCVLNYKARGLCTVFLIRPPPHVLHSFGLHSYIFRRAVMPLVYI